MHVVSLDASLPSPPSQVPCDDTVGPRPHAPAAPGAQREGVLETPPRPAEPPATPRPEPPRARRLVKRVLFTPPPLAAVREDLFVATAAQAGNLALLQRAGITHIINATVEHADAFPSHFTYLRAPVVDRPSTQLTPYFDAAIAFDAAARRSGGRLLVHCHAGVSRSAALATAVLMAREGLARPAAMAALRAVRPSVAPNGGFVAALDTWWPAGAELADRARVAAEAASALLAAWGMGCADEVAWAGATPAPLGAGAALLRWPDIAEDALAALVQRQWEVHGRLDAVHARARRRLGAWLQACVAEGLPGARVRGALGRLTEASRWTELCLDLPGASHTFLPELVAACPCLAAAAPAPGNAGAPTP